MYTLLRNHIMQVVISDAVARATVNDSPIENDCEFFSAI